MAELFPEKIARPVAAFINAQTWNESKRIVEAHRDELLSDDADLILASLLEQFRDNANATHQLEERRDLLARCRRNGIEAAYAEQQRFDELKTILDEIARLRDSRDVPHMVELCRAALKLANPNTQPYIWAVLQNSLATYLTESPLGERTKNLEEAIRHYHQALKVSTYRDYPENWAEVHYNLAATYSERIRGERAKNLEMVISHYLQALEVYTRKAFPEQWANIQYYLAIAYSERIRGERAENLEQAIFYNQQALEVYTRESVPERWAMTQHNLANAYGERIRGVRAENLEQAIYICQQALKVSTRQAFPVLWADLQHNLASSYLVRIRGERAENLEQAFYHCKQALEVRTRQNFPKQWAATQNNLGSVYRERIRGERAENLEQAISHYLQALKVYTRQAFPEQWALMQANLASAYSERIRGERAENLEQAIHHYQLTLKVYTRQAFPEQWASIQYNLAHTYFVRILGEREANLEKAISLCQQALEIRTHRAFPEQWAETQNSLAIIYSQRTLGERAENLEQAIHYFEHALEVRTPMAFPQDCLDTAYWLGRLLYDERRFSEARHALGTAHQAVEALRGEMQRDIAKHSLSEENADLYARLVACCLREGDEAAAFAYAAAGKGRAFVDLLATARFDLSAASANDPALADDLHRARVLRQQIDTLLATLTGESVPSRIGLSSTTGIKPPSRIPLPLDVLRAQLSALQAQEASHWDDMAYKYPALTATQKAPALSADQARTLAAELDATLVECYRHAEGWCAFVVTPNSMHHVPLPLLDDNLLQRMVNWMLRLEYPVGRNLLSYTRLSEWHNAVIAPLETYLPQKQPVVLAPFGVLHVLPLAAALDPHTGRYVAEDYQIAFAPSLSALRTVCDQAHRVGRDEQMVPHRLLSVAYPGAPDSDHYLPNVLPEAQAIARHFTQVTPLYQEAATPEAILEHSRDQDAIHFGCHGWFDAEQPEQSGLMLAGGWLTVQRIITELRLEQARVATLGACLSGRAALQGGDEHMGLLQAMLTTGAQAVVSSLWSVDDAATRVFFETFYTVLVAGHSPARALQEGAQSVQEHPGWEHPYYWAAFQVSGLAHGAREPEQPPLPTT